MKKNKYFQEQDRLMDFMDALADLSLPEPKDEMAQINRLRLFGIWYFVGFLIFFGLLGLAANFIAPVAGMVFVAMVAAVIFIRSGGNRYAKAYGDALKQKLLREMLSQDFQKLRLRGDMGLPMDYAKKSGLLKFSERHYRSDDFLSAMYRDVPFRRADVYAAQTLVDAKTGKKCTTLFEGRWMVFFLPQETTVDMIIHQKHFDAAVSFEDTEEPSSAAYVPYYSGEESFDRDFVVYTADRSKARELLDTKRMQQIREYCDLSDGNVLVAFRGRELHVLIDSDRNAMEPDPYSKDCEVMLREEISKEIDVIECTAKILLGE